MFLDKGHIGAVIEFMSYGMTFVDETLCSRLGKLPLKWGQGLKAEVLAWCAFLTTIARNLYWSSSSTPSKVPALVP
jgi:hypothetical protein